MDASLYYYAILGFVALSAIAMLTQAIAAVTLARRIKRIEEQITPLVPRAEAALEAARETLAEGRAQIREVGTKSLAVLESAQGRLTQLDSLITETSDRARLRLDKTEMALDNAMVRVQDTIGAVQKTVLSPIREIHGITAGIRAAVQHLVSGRRPNPDRATQDEEMFI